MSSQPPWETQIQPGWGSQPEQPEQPGQPQQQPQPQQGGGGWNQGSYAPQQPPQAPPRQGGGQYPPQGGGQYPQGGGQYPQQYPQQGGGQYPQQGAGQYPQQGGGHYPQQGGGPYPQYGQQPTPPQFTPPQMPGMPYPNDEPPPKKNTGRVIAIIAAVVVLVGGAGGIYLFTKSDKNSPKTQTTPTATATTSKPSATPAASSSATIPNNSYTGSTAPPASGSATGGGATLDKAATDKTPFTAAAMVAKTFKDDKNVTYTLKNAAPVPCNKVGDPVVQKIVTSAKCGDLMAAAWIDPGNRIVVSAMVIPYQDSATAAAIYKKLGATHTGDYAQWCPPSGQPGYDTCTKLPKAANATREGKFGAFHRYVLITTAVYVDLRNDTSQKDWLTSAAHGAFQNTLPGQ